MRCGEISVGEILPTMCGNTDTGKIPAFQSNTHIDAHTNGGNHTFGGILSDWKSFYIEHKGVTQNNDTKEDDKMTAMAEPKVQVNTSHTRKWIVV